MGNVWEWCEDWYGPYDVGASTDPQGAAKGSARVLRGGSWFNNPWYCRSAKRAREEPGTRNLNLGFRVVVVVSR